MDNTSSNPACTPAPRSKSSLLDDFAQYDRLRVTRDECGDKIIRGRYGDVSDSDDGKTLAASFWGQDEEFSRTRAHRIRQAVIGNYGRLWAGGIGGDEAVILFSSVDERAAAFFIHALGIRRKRRVSSDVVERLRSLAKGSKGAAGEAFQGVGRVDGAAPASKYSADELGSQNGFPATKSFALGGGK